MKLLNENKGQVFLATTALEDFWDTSKPIAFLGEWCKRYSRRDYLKSLDTVMAPTWYDRKKLPETYRYIYNVYEKLLPLVGNALNTIHKVNYSTQYWRILIGIWLFHFIDIVHDRYTSIRLALDQYPELTTIGLDQRDYVIANDGWENMHRLASQDGYNLQLYTKILKAIGKNFPYKPLKLHQKQKYDGQSSHTKIGFTDKLKAGFNLLFSDPKDFILTSTNLIKRYKNKLLNKKPSIFMYQSYFPLHVEKQLIQKMKGKLAGLEMKAISLPSNEINHHARKYLKQIKFEEDEFGVIFIKLLPYELPKAYVEGYQRVKSFVNQHYPLSPKVIFSAVGWYVNDFFKLWAAQSAENGTKLLGAQHGGNYGVNSILSAYDLERSLTHQYYTWGWSDLKHSSVKPLLMNKLMGLKKMGADNTKSGILFTGTGFTRYLYRTQIRNLPYEFDSYISWQQRFVASLSIEKRKILRLRFWWIDGGWDVLERWKDRFADIETHIETWNIPFNQSLENCRIHITDHIETTYIESFTFNKPTIIFIDPDVGIVSEEAKAYFAELKEVKILYNSPEEAAHAVNSIYDDIESWWNEPKRQVAVRKFCFQFARTSPNAVEEWVNEFKSILKEV